MDNVELKGRIIQAPSLIKTAPPDFRERLLSPWPKIGVRTVIIGLIVLVAYLWGLQGTHVDVNEFVEGVPNIVNFIVRLFPPEFQVVNHTVSIPPALSSWLGEAILVPLPEIISAIFETIQMAIIGTSLAILLSLPFGLLAARNTTPRPIVYQTTRMIMNMIRAVPEIIFALIFVSAVGLGPFGGVLAIAVGAVGFLGKLYAESIEAIDPQQVLAVRATGSTPLQAFRFGVLPQALPLIASYSILSFENNVRSATILGLVGAGGVGFVITKYIALFQFHKLMGALILIIITVTIVDRISDRLRKKFT